MKKDIITIYEKPTCSTCRVAMALLKDMGVEFEAVDYYEEPLTVEKLTALIRKMKISPRELLRTREPIYKELALDKKEISDGNLIRLMVEHPDLMQRPIVEQGERAVLGRPIENLKKLFGK